jgi:hypothetical protein
MNNSAYKRGDTQKYRDVVRLIEQYGMGEGVFRSDALAIELAKINPRHSAKVNQTLLRALAQAEGRGLIERFQYISDLGGNAKAYRVCSNEERIARVPF